jgi:hypothetical protein
MPGVFTPSEVHIDEVLTNMTIAHMQNANNFVAPRVFPNIPVDFQSDKYYVWDRGFYNRLNEVEKAAPGTESPEISLSVSTDSYYIDLWHLGASFSEQQLANEDTQLRTRSVAAATLANRGMLKREQDFISTFFGPGIWSTQYEGVANGDNNLVTEVTQRDDYTNSTPIVDVRRAKTAMHLASSGVAFGNEVVFLVTRDVLDILLDHPDILGRMNTGVTPDNPALADMNRLAQILGVDEVVVFDAVGNSAAEGQARNEDFLVNKRAALISRPVSPGLEVASAGYTFTWNSLPNNSGLGTSILSYVGHDDLVRKKIAEKIEIYMGWDMKVTSPDLGVFFNTIIS